MSLVAILGDWGTTNVRLWAIDDKGVTLASRALDKGMSRLTPSDYEPVITEFINEEFGPFTRPVDLILCGMVGARQGWKEAPYSSLGSQSRPRAVKVDTNNTLLNVFILPGLKQQMPPDVMRGEETQIEGFVAENPGFQGTLCLPGTHSKWVQINQGLVTHFQTAMTGELFFVLKKHSTLGFSMQGGWDAAQFEQAVLEGFEHSASLLSKLFSKRAATLISDTPFSGISAISGLLIGSEFAASQRFTREGTVYLIGGDQLADHYAQAASVLDIKAVKRSGDTLVIQGLKSAYQSLKRGTLCIES